VPGSSGAASAPPESVRSWASPTREDGRAITGLIRRSETEGPVSQLPPLVLLVKAGEHEDGPLCNMLRAAGYGLMLRHDASAGYHAARQVLPDVVVIDFDLPDEPGDLFVRRVRSDPSRLAATPIVLIAAPADTRTRIARFATGADVCILKPFRFGDVVAQVAALVKMSARLRSAREALPYVSSAGDKIFQGDLSQISIGAMLTILEMERRSGVFDIHSAGRRAQLEIVAGRMTKGAALDRPLGPLATVRTVLRWGSGRFSFRSIPLRAPPADAPSISEILTEALRLQDEEDHDDVAP
jgi:two-component system, OmpR family, response regulator